MSFDGRLREGLVTSSTAIDERDVDLVFGRVVRGAHRRRALRRIVATAVVLAVGVAALVLVPKAIDTIRSDRSVPAGPQAVGTISTVAGTGLQGTTIGEGGPATKAEIVHPADLGFDAAGNLYILQYFPGSVRQVDANGVITTAFAGEPGHTDIGTSESMTGMFVEPDGTLYLALNEQNRIIRVTPTGDVSTLAGTGRPGFSGDGGPAIDARLRLIWDVAVDPEGNVYISTDDRIRMVDTQGIITTIAGTGEAGYSGDGGPADEARIDSPGGLSIGPDGEVYFIDQGSVIRRIHPNGTIATIAGTDEPGFAGDGGPAKAARFDGPEQMWVTTDGTIFVGDTNNRRVRRIDTNGIVTTVAGTGKQAFSGDGGLAIEANLAKVGGVAIGPNGNLYIADFSHERIRMVVL